MLGGFELRYLAAVAEGKDFPVAARTIPAVLRGLATKGARKRVSEVMLASSHADDAAHVHRVAYLRLVGREPPNHDDKADIARAFAAHRSPARERRAPLVFVASVVGIVGAVVGSFYGWRLATRRPPPVVLPSSTLEVPMPTVVEVLTGADVQVHPIEPVVREAVPNWVVALDAESAGRPRAAPHDVTSAHAAVLTALAEAHADAEIVEAMRAFLVAAEEHSARPSRDGDERVTRALVALDDAFARHEVPFYVDAILTESRVADRRRVLASSFRVRGRRIFRSGERRITSLDLERIDTLNFERSLLGYTRPDVRYALVLTSRVENFLVGRVLPSIHAAEESVIVRGYENERDIGWVTTFETAAHDVLREEAGAIVPAPSIAALASATARRRHAFDAVAQELDEHGWRLRPIETYAYDPDLVRGLELVAPTTRRELSDAQAALDASSVLATYRAFEEAELFSIAQHEAQHRVDFEDDRIIAVPDALARYVGRTEFEDRVNHLAESCNAELSAYLSQIARDPIRARSHVVQVSTFVMARDAWGMAETYAAIVIFEELARELGLEPGEIVRPPSVVRAEVARLFLAIRARTGQEVADAARRAWQRLYGVALPPLELER